MTHKLHQFSRQMLRPPGWVRSLEKQQNKKQKTTTVYQKWDNSLTYNGGTRNRYK